MTFIKMRNCFGSFEKADNVKHLYAPKAMSNPQNQFSDGRTVHAPPGVSRQQCSNPLPIPDPSSQVQKNKNGNSQVSPSEHQILSSPKLKSFLHNELKKATQNFHQDNLLGEGGFGRVYKGWLDENDFTASAPGSGIAVAVKKLKPQGLQGHKEWLCEVEYLGRLYHPNLVKLIGFCLEGENRLLVYEFMPQGSLESHLFKRSKKSLPWETRVKIALGAARGLCFLHEPESQVIYRDFKASNILLDSEFNAKLSDFGLARKGPSGDDTHVTTAVMGTEGYAAPEYIRTGKLTTMCDVYSFGVVLFELLTGRRAVDYTKDKSEQHLINWVKPHMRDKKSFLRIMDGRLEGKYPRKGAFIAATLALHCVNSERKFRPTMNEVIGYLEFLLLPKFMSFTSPSQIQQMPQQSSDDSPPDSPVTLGKNASSVDSWPAPKRAPSPSKNHGVGGGPQRKSSPTGPRKCKHRSRLSGSIVSTG